MTIVASGDSPGSGACIGTFNPKCFFSSIRASAFDDRDAGSGVTLRIWSNGL